MLSSGQRLHSNYEIDYKVVKLLGSGGQGEVYDIEVGAKHYALKWYYPHMSTPQQKAILMKLLETGSPDQRFLWPLDYIEKDGQFGYVMPLRPVEYKSIVDLMKRKAEPSFKALCKAGYELSDAFQKLHSLGYSYCDISFGNAFLNPDTGEILICDNDNVVVNGESLEGVQGTLGFMAPEIIKGEKGPSTETDLFSLAILLFYMFMLHHPLEGAREANIKCLDIHAKQKLYGEDPLFIWDPQDDSNRPIAGYQDNAIIYWRLYPNFIKQLFTAAFTDGMKNPNKRIVENQWKRAFLKLSDHIMHCAHCGAENFYEGEEHIGVKPICWCCNHTLETPIVLELHKQYVVLEKDTVIYKHHLEQNFDLDTAIAKVTKHPSLDKWGLQNVTAKDWQGKKPNGEKLIVPSQKNAPLAAGLQLIFEEGQIGIIKKG